MNYKKQKLEKNISSSENTWKLSKQFMNWKSTGSPHQLEINGNIISKAFNIAEEMNSFFYNTVEKIRSEINKITWTPESCNQIMRNKKCKLDLGFPTKFEVLKILKNLSNSRCSAIDCLDNFIIKIASDLILDPLHHIIVLSIMQEKFPSDWKLAKVIPLHKKRGYTFTKEL